MGDKSPEEGKIYQALAQKGDKERGVEIVRFQNHGIRAIRSQSNYEIESRKGGKKKRRRSSLQIGTCTEETKKS